MEEEDRRKRGASMTDTRSCPGSARAIGETIVAETERLIELEAAFLLSLAKNNCPTDIAEFLVRGDAMRGVPPRLIQKAIKKAMPAVAQGTCPETASPVAWRWKWAEGDFWKYSDDADMARVVSAASGKSVVAEPLYSLQQARGVAQSPNETYRDTVRSIGAAREKRLSELREALWGAKAYVEGAIASFAGDRADNDFLKGYLAALEVVRDEAFSLPSTSQNTAED